ncbi:hypothetical protein DFH06DRAFT_1206257 [Mycena polygramma]|nr:hypothetical protein DFH06DRAFT_1206257 [Mycena polygramma]
MAVKTRLSHSPPDLVDSERPSQRQKLEATEPSTKLPPTPRRHEEFFKEDGDCYLQVENILFKIHRHHLLRGGFSIFADMFMIPSGDSTSQGNAESDPIVLAGDTAERFTGFLSVAYAELLDFQIADMCQHRLLSLIDCAFFAHKYNITPLLMASLRAVAHLAEHAIPLDFEASASILALSSLCDDDDDDECNTTSACDLEEAVAVGWMSQLNDRSTYEDLAEAMDFGEDYELENLLALAAALYLKRMSSVERPLHTPSAPVFAFRDDDFLRPSHRLRILSGAWSLEQLWTRFTTAIPAFATGVVCSQARVFPRNLDFTSHKTTCVEQWEKDWRAALSSKAVREVSCGHLAKKLLAFEKALQPAFEAGCSKTAFNSVNPVATLRKSFDAHDHFLDR